MSKKINIFFASIIFSILLWGSIALSDFYYTNIDVRLALVNFPSGYTTGAALPERVNLRVKGQGWRLFSLNVGPEAEFTISVDFDSGKKVISMYDFIESNRWLFSEVDIISIQPDSLRFFIERITSKKLPVISALDLEFKPGYGLASDIIFTPDSVLVFGPASFLKSVNDLKTESRFFGSLDSRIETEVRMQSLNGFTFDDNVIDVMMDVQKIVDKEFDNILVEVLDLPQGREVVLLPNRISINIRGGIDILGKLNISRLHAYVKYRDLVQDTTGSISPIIEVPKNVSLQYLKPERLRYIIRSF